MEEDKNIESPSVSEIIKPTPTPVNPIKPASKFSIKAIIGTIIFLLLAGGAAAGYVYREPIMSFVSKPTPTPIATQTSPTPTPDPTADWKTYEGDGYSIKYPSKLNIVPKEQGNPNKDDSFHITNQENPKSPGLYLDAPDNQYYEIIISVEPTNGQNLEDVTKHYDGFSNRKNYSRKSAKIDNIEGFFVTDVSLDSISDITYVIKNDKIYSVILRHFPETKDIDDAKNIYNQILSTFKFTDEQTDTSNWKTYKNSEYHYSIKYPKDWNIGVAGDANPETFPSPYISSPCYYQKGTLCSQINIGVSVPKDSNDLTPGFIVDDKIYNKSLITVDGERASEFDWFDSDYYTDSKNQGRILHIVVTQKGGYKYSITYEESQKNQLFRTPKDWKAKNTFDQILSTFKFTK